MKREQTNNRGVTLVELVVALAVLAMLMVAVIMLMSNNTVIYRKTKADISVQTAAQETYNSLQDSIMQAKYLELSGYKEGATQIFTYKKKSLISEGESFVGFDELMNPEAKEGSPYTTIYPTKLVIRYSVENSDEIDNKNCTVTYYFCRYDDPEVEAKRVDNPDIKKQQKCNVYVTREYDPSTGLKSSMWATSESGWTPAKGTGSTSEDRDKFADYLCTQALAEAKMTVDYSTQTFSLDLDFWDRGQKYNTSGVVSCRNSYITKDLRSRTTESTDPGETKPDDTKPDDTKPDETPKEQENGN